MKLSDRNMTVESRDLPPGKSPGAAITIRGLSKSFEGQTVLDQLDLEVLEGEFLTLLGPSGCGKTTMLRCLAGLEEPDSGSIQMGDRAVVDIAAKTMVPPERRDVGLVFQSYALWPHMTVFSNVAYPLRRRKVSRREVGPRVEDALASVGLSSRKDDYVTQLSGGQQQRVALARAFAHSPSALLFDEPLSNLDANLRLTMRAEIRRVHEKVGATSVYVTHDQQEALVLSDRIVVMNEGLIQQIGTAQEIYSEPENRFVAEFVGFDNVVPTSPGESRGGRTVVGVAGGSAAIDAAPTGGGTFLAFRAEEAHLVEPGAESDGIGIRGTISARVFAGRDEEIDVSCGGQRLMVRRPTHLIGEAKSWPETGDDVVVVVDPARAVLLGDAKKSKPTEE